MDDSLTELVGSILEAAIEIVGSVLPTSVVRVPRIGDRYTATTSVRIPGRVFTPDRQLATRFTPTLQTGDLVVVREISAARGTAILAVEESSLQFIPEGSSV